MNSPLADRMRPNRIEDVAGQRHLLEKGRVLRKIIDSGDVPNLIFYGPSGVGKTTVASATAISLADAGHRVLVRHGHGFGRSPSWLVKGHLYAFLFVYQHQCSPNGYVEYVACPNGIPDGEGLLPTPAYTLDIAPDGEHHEVLPTGLHGYEQ